MYFVYLLKIKHSLCPPKSTNMVSFISSAISLLLSPLTYFIHPDFHQIFERMTLLNKFLFLIIHGVDKSGIPWHRLPVLLGLIYLAIRRRLHEEYNLMKVGKTPVGSTKFTPSDFAYRSANGKFNDPLKELAGSQGTFFGRNMPADDDHKHKAGVNMVAELIGVTLGPRGRNVVLQNKYGPPKIVNDGETVLKEIQLGDPLENVGVKLVRQDGAKTNDLAGDGSTTSIILAQGLIAEGVKVTAAGMNPIQISRGIQRTAEALVLELKLMSRELMKPDPMVVATKLLARKELKDTGKQFNIIAASWIQFMIHDWIDHLESTQQIELEAPVEVANECPLKSFKLYKTKEVDTGFSDIKKAHSNLRTHWWDGSVVYGSNSSKMHLIRTFKDGKLKIGKDGLLQHDNNGLPIAGDTRNSWIGVSTLQALFIQEHNAVCDALKNEYPHLEDEKLYGYARLVTSAVIAKIHTIDWTIELLKTDTLVAGMRANWYGLLGKRFKDTFGHVGGVILGGLVGLKESNNHGVPYSLTEEFTSVYRMHSLLPDQLLIRDVNSKPGPNKSPKLAKEIDMINLIGKSGEKELLDIGFTTQMVSMGHQACGALELWNYPLWLRNIVPQNVDGTDRPDHIDLASLDIYRDRERNVARYNDFRRSLLLIPISKWEDLTDDKEAIDTLREVYNDDVEQLDLLVGMAAEKKIKGFAISETAFIIFLVMASRRLEADRFFTSDFKEEIYTKKGFEWVNTTESLKDVLDRHYPEMTDRWMNSTSAFSVWDAPPEPHNPVPIYFRVPK